jgi:predicted dehydrogenase
MKSPPSTVLWTPNGGRLTAQEQRSGRITRRTFIKAGAATALTAASWARVYGANERIGIGMIGFGLIGRIHTRNFKAQPDVNIVGLAEVYQPRLEAAAQLVGGKVAEYRDFRRLLDNKDVDAVVISTADHWHALMTMMACAAGKDAYVEKPLTLFVREGRWMTDVARRYNRVVQVGTQQRSGLHYQKARQMIQTGYLGDIVAVQVKYYRNLMPGFGNPPDQNPPPELDWEMMLGPAPYRPYNPNRGIYHFRWFWDYSGGQMTNLGHHSLDIVHWFMNVDGPTAVTSTGGRFFLKDNCEVPDTQDAIIEYPKFVANVEYRECTSMPQDTGMGGLVFYGTKGSMVLSRDGYEVIPSPKRNPMNIVAAIIGGHPVGGPQPVPEPKGKQLWTEPDKAEGDWQELYVLHVRNFLDCIKSRKTPLSDVQSGHQIATACHLTNISLKTGRKIRWDAKTEQIIDDPEAARMLVRQYRSPWDQQLRSLNVT